MKSRGPHAAASSAARPVSRGGVSGGISDDIDVAPAAPDTIPCPSLEDGSLAATGAQSFVAGRPDASVRSRSVNSRARSARVPARWPFHSPTLTRSMPTPTTRLLSGGRCPHDLMLPRRGHEDPMIDPQISNKRLRLPANAPSPCAGLGCDPRDAIIARRRKHALAVSRNVSGPPPSL